MSTKIAERSVRSLTFRCREAGERGEPVILLHGFPETSAMWDDLIPLADAGYRVLAPDQRGYSPGARPQGAEQYVLHELVADVVALADDAGFERFHLVGHDWGAAAGWAVVDLHARRVASFTALSVPHLKAFRNAIAGSGDQSQRSGYMSFFRQEGAAEATMSADDFAGLKNLWSVNDEATREEYYTVLSQPGALTGALNWYRAQGGLEDPGAPLGAANVDTPTLFIWGNRDTAIGREAAEGCAQYVSGPFEFVEVDAGHWLAQEAPAELATDLLAHLRKFAIAP